MATALELVNRVRRQLRWPDTASFTSEEDRAVLDQVNAAVATIFEGWDWECDIRHDGVLRTMPSRTETALSFTTASTTVDWPNTDSGLAYTETMGALATNPIIQIVATDDTGFGDTSFRVTDVATALSGFFTITRATLAEAFPGTTDTSASATICANSYVLPSTVRKLLSVRSQEQSIRLEEAERFQFFDRYIQKPHETISDETELVIFGSIGTSTTGTALLADPIAAVTGPFALLYPTPDTTQVYHYSYLLRRAEFTATTDALSNVDRSLEDLVVRLAYARCVQNYVGDADAGTGIGIEQRVLGLARDLHANQGKDPNRRRVLGSNFAECGGVADFGRFPRNYGTGT